MITLVWFRNDLRLADHPALAHALETSSTVIPCYLCSPDEEAPWEPGSASRWWLHHSLSALDASLRRLGSRLIVRTGAALASLQQLIKETGATQVVWNRRYEQHIIDRDQKIKTALKEQGTAVQSFNGSLLIEPFDIKTKDGKPYQVFTPFWKCHQVLVKVRKPLTVPQALPSPGKWPRTQPLDSLKLLPKVKWDAGFHEQWTPGEANAQRQLQRFCEDTAESYAQQRDLPGSEGTSRLSPSLHFGELSPHQVWDRLYDYEQRPSQFEVFQKELVWREFAYHLLYHFPRTATEPLRTDFARFPWESDQRLLRSWQKGQTGYPLVDAGMRELWATGWMHNRVRMVVASFLVKHLLISWKHGAAWFWDTLVDADLASNTLGWQWTAGCGADAAPYFRIFNPIQQGERFDPTGRYVRHWLPELSTLPDAYIHAPWTAPHLVLHEANISLGSTYPYPIVDHKTARLRALQAYGEMKKNR